MALSKALANARHSNRVRQLAAELAADQKIRLDHAGDLIAGYVESDKVTDEQFVTAARNLHPFHSLVAHVEADELREDARRRGRGPALQLLAVKLVALRRIFREDFVPLILKAATR